MAPNPKDVLALAERIVAVEEELSILKSKWDALFGASAKPQGINPTSIVASKTRDHTFTGNVKKLLEGEPGRIFTIGQVAAAMKEDTLKTGRTLFRMAQRAQIDSPDRGQYRAKRKLEVAA